jgi:hypothetical protein
MTQKTMNRNVPTEPCSQSESLMPCTIQCPGLTNRHNRLNELAVTISKALSVQEFKRNVPFLWCVIAGGTGTGKSSIFNALCSESLSVPGVERPKTKGAVAYAHVSFPEISHFPFILPPIKRIQEDKPGFRPTTGIPNRIVMFTHRRRDMQHIVLVDTPDLDSLDHAGQDIAEDTVLQADFVIFIASQEKYADQVPANFLHKVVRGGTPCLLVLNKAAPEASPEEIRETLELHGISIPISHIAIIPHGGLQGGTPQPHLESLTKTFFEKCNQGNEEFLRHDSLRRLEERIAESAGEAVEILEKEIKESKIWLEKLAELHSRSCEEFLRSEEARLTDERTRHLHLEVRKLFSRYDVLAGPRRLIQSVLAFPLRLIGVGFSQRRRDRKEELATMRGKLNLAPLFAALEDFNRSVLGSLSPMDSSAPVHARLRDTPILDESEVYKMVADAQRELEIWLASTFEDLEQRLPRSKKWGIYTTAVMWGVLIVSLETALGGGFTVIDAALGSALAPFATKGAVELFALREIQKIAKELSRRLRNGLVSVLDEQKNRYEQHFMSLMPKPATIDRLKLLAQKPQYGKTPARHT